MQALQAQYDALAAIEKQRQRQSFSNQNDNKHLQHPSSQQDADAALAIELQQQYEYEQKLIKQYPQSSPTRESELQDQQIAYELQLKEQHKAKMREQRRQEKKKQKKKSKKPKNQQAHHNQAPNQEHQEASIHQSKADLCSCFKNLFSRQGESVVALDILQHNQQQQPENDREQKNFAPAEGVLDVSDDEDDDNDDNDDDNDAKEVVFQFQNKSISLKHLNSIEKVIATLCPVFLCRIYDRTFAKKLCQNIIYSFTGMMSMIQFCLLLAVLIDGKGIISMNENYLCGPSESMLSKFGGTRPNMFFDNEIWRLITPIFLHGGIIHFICNMYVQWRACWPWEQEIGIIRVMFVYLLGGMEGAVASNICTRSHVTVCATAGLLSIMGAKVGRTIVTWAELPPLEHAYNIIQGVSFAIVVMLIGLLVPTLDTCGHAGGFVFGFLLSFSLFTQEYVITFSTFSQKVIVFASRLVLIGGIVFQAVLIAGRGRIE